MIDTHAHIYLDAFDSDREEVIGRAQARGVNQILLPNVDLDTIPAMHRLEEAYPGYCLAMMGLHPCSVDANFESVLKTIRQWLDERTYIGIGEIGIDLYWDKSFVDQQKEAFKIQVGWAHDMDLPIVIHSRESIDEILGILEDLNLTGLRGVFHCFTGNHKQAQRILDLGFYMGIGGVVTFKNAGLDKTLKEIDPGRLILETDAPYLTPHPHRGKRNESAYLYLVAEKLGEIYDIPATEVDRITSQGAHSLFALTRS